MREAIARNLSEVRARIERAASRGRRDPSSVVLVAVAKTRTVEEIAAAREAGVRHIGENRVAEAAAKQQQLGSLDVEWHMVGHLQSRKARQAVSCFDVIQSVDSVKLARRLDRLAAEAGHRLRVLVEVNVGGEETKYGFSPADEGLIGKLAEIAALPSLCVEGLMTVAPIVPRAELARPVFARLRTLRDELRVRVPGTAWTHLSMGMTDDYEIAVEEGATMVRIGRAIFGPRGEE